MSSLEPALEPFPFLITPFSRPADNRLAFTTGSFSLNFSSALGRKVCTQREFHFMGN